MGSTGLDGVYYPFTREPHLFSKRPPTGHIQKTTTSALRCPKKTRPKDAELPAAQAAASAQEAQLRLEEQRCRERLGLGARGEDRGLKAGGFWGWFTGKARGSKANDFVGSPF